MVLFKLVVKELKDSICKKRLSDKPPHITKEIYIQTTIDRYTKYKKSYTDSEMR